MREVLIYLSTKIKNIRRKYFLFCDSRALNQIIISLNEKVLVGKNMGFPCDFLKDERGDD